MCLNFHVFLFFFCLKDILFSTSYSADLFCILEKVLLFQKHFAGCRLPGYSFSPPVLQSCFIPLSLFSIVFPRSLLIPPFVLLYPKCPISLAAFKIFSILLVFSRLLVMCRCCFLQFSSAWRLHLQSFSLCFIFSLLTVWDFRYIYVRALDIITQLFNVLCNFPQSF